MSRQVTLWRMPLQSIRSTSIKGKIKKALFYPAAVLVMAFVVTAVLMIFVIPQFATLFDDFGADLPAMTLFVISA